MKKPDEEDFNKAVEIACRVIKRARDPSGVGLRFVGWLDDNQPEAAEHNTDLINEAKKDRTIFDALCRQIADGLRSGETIPRVILKFGCEVLEGKIKKPRGKRKPDYKYRSALVSAISEVARGTPLYLTRNDESEHQMSVLDAVVKAIHLTAGKRMTYGTLKQDFYPSAREQIELDRHSEFSWLD